MPQKSLKEYDESGVRGGTDNSHISDKEIYGIPVQKYRKETWRNGNELMG
jgi:hypothetical protein